MSPLCSSSLVSPLQGCQHLWSPSLSASHGPKATGQRASTWGQGDTGLGTGTTPGWQCREQGMGTGVSPLHQPLRHRGPRSCWLSLEGGLLYAFVGPAAVIVLVSCPQSLGPQNPPQRVAAPTGPGSGVSVPNPDCGTPLAQGEHASRHHRVQQAHVP